MPYFGKEAKSFLQKIQPGEETEFDPLSWAFVVCYE
jgi:hypothetical protein